MGRKERSAPSIFILLKQSIRVDEADFSDEDTHAMRFKSVNLSFWRTLFAISKASQVSLLPGFGEKFEIATETGQRSIKKSASLPPRGQRSISAVFPAESGQERENRRLKTHRTTCNTVTCNISKHSAKRRNVWSENLQGVSRVRTATIQGQKLQHPNSSSARKKMCLVPPS